MITYPSYKKSKKKIGLFLVLLIISTLLIEQFSYGPRVHSTTYFVPSSYDDNPRPHSYDNIHTNSSLSSSSALTTKTNKTSSSGEEWWWLKSSILSTITPDELSKDIRPYHDCGYTKCYFPSLTHLKYGYVVARLYPGWSLDKMNTILQRTYDMAVDLKTKFGLRHPLKTPFVYINTTTTTFTTTTTTTAKRLIEKLNAPTEEGRTFGKKQKHFSLQGQGIFIQIVESIPQPHQFIHIKKKKSYKGLDRSELKRFFFNSTMIGLFPNSSTFKTNLLRDWNSTLEAINAMPDLLRDYQMIFDYTGKIWHIDLDRVFSDNPKTNIKQIQKCIDLLLTYHEQQQATTMVMVNQST